MNPAALEMESLTQQTDLPENIRTEAENMERNRLIVHLARVFARRFDIQVIPSGEKGVWATALDPKISAEMGKYIDGRRATLDDLPDASFVPRQILYDAESAQAMSMDEINTILHHEAGHAKFTDFRSMVEGQRQAKDEGHLPTSFWLTFEGIEDPRVNSLEGEESPAIDRQIRANQGSDLQKRITETPLQKRPAMLQFAFNSFHYWLHGEGIPELQDTEVGRLGQVARPLLEQYFLNTDLKERKILQRQIWDIAKALEKKDIEDEKMRQMQQQKQQTKQQDGKEGQEQGQTGQGQPDQGLQSSGESQGQSNQNKRIIDKLMERFFKPKSQPGQSGQPQQATPHDISPPSSPQPAKERIDLSELSDEEIQQLKEAIDRLTPAQKADLERKARAEIDELQRKAIEEDFSKSFKFEKNPQTGNYEAKPVLADEKTQKQAQQKYQETLKKVSAEEQAEAERLEQERQQQEAARREQERLKREATDMQKSGFKTDEREAFLIYQSLEDSMISSVRRFNQAIQSVMPRRKEPTYEGGFFSGSKFDRRDLVKRAPLGNEQFWQRQTESPTGEPRLFIGLVVDNTASMSGKKIEEARKVMIFFAKVCEDNKIPFMMTSFGREAKTIKSFKQQFDKPSERIKPELIESTDASAGSTNLQAGIAQTIEAMNEQRRRQADSHGIVFVITDGAANTGLTGEDLSGYIQDNKGRLTYKAFGLSDEYERQEVQDSLNLYFGEGNCAFPENFDDLPDEAFRVLRINLIQFQRFLS